MKRILIITLIIVSCLDSSGQRKMTKTYYKNGQLESAGFVYKYPIFYDVNKLPPWADRFRPGCANTGDNLHIT
jgi:hypothetical protein